MTRALFPLVQSHAEYADFRAQYPAAPVIIATSVFRGSARAPARPSAPCAACGAAVRTVSVVSRFGSCGRCGAVVWAATGRVFER